MKRADLIRHLERNGCTLKREGGSVAGTSGPNRVYLPLTIKPQPQLAQLTRLSGAIGVLAAQGHLLFLASGSGLEVLDTTSDPPGLVGSLALPSGPRAVTAILPAGHLLYLVVRGTSLGAPQLEGSLLTLDVSDPAHPQLLGAQPFGPITLISSTVRTAALLAADRLVVSIDSGLLIYDLTHPAEPRLAGQYPSQAPWYAAYGRYLYTPQGVLDLSDPAAPRQAGAIPVTDPNFGIGQLAVVGSTLYVLSSETVVCNSMIWCYTERLQAFDLADPSAPAPQGRIDFPQPYYDGAWFTAAGPGLIVMGGGLNPNVQEIIDIRDPLRPTLVSRLEDFPAPYPNRGAVSGSRLLFALAGNLLVYDATDPAQLQPRRPYNPPLPAELHTLLKLGPQYSLASGRGDQPTNSYSPSFTLLNMDGSSTPRIIGPDLLTTDDFAPIGGAVAGDRLLVLEQRGRLRVFEGVTAGRLAERASAVVAEEPRALALHQRYAYIADRQRGLIVVDVEAAGGPSVVRTIALPTASRVAVQGEQLYVAAGFEQIEQITYALDDPRAPVEQARTRIGYNWLSFPALDPSVYLADRAPNCPFASVCDRLSVARRGADWPPQLVGSVDLEGDHYRYKTPAVYQIGDHVVSYSSSRGCLTQPCLGTGALVVIDVSDPARPLIGARVYLWQAISAHTLHGRQILAADGDLTLYAFPPTLP